MKSILCLFVTCFCCVIFVAGCFSPTKTTITTYDNYGNIQNVTETSESVVKSVVESTKEKMILVYSAGWDGKITATAATTDNPVPTLEIRAGNIKTGYLSVPATVVNWDGVGKVVQSAGYNLEVNEDGISGKSE